MTDKSVDGSYDVNNKVEIFTCHTDKNDSKEQTCNEKNLSAITLSTQSTERPTTVTDGSIMACMLLYFIPFQN